MITLEIIHTSFYAFLPIILSNQVSNYDPSHSLKDDYAKEFPTYPLRKLYLRKIVDVLVKFLHLFHILKQIVGKEI